MFATIFCDLTNGMMIAICILDFGKGNTMKILNPEIVSYRQYMREDCAAQYRIMLKINKIARKNNGKIGIVPIVG